MSPPGALLQIYTTSSLAECSPPLSYLFPPSYFLLSSVLAIRNVVDHEEQTSSYQEKRLNALLFPQKRQKSIQSLLFRELSQWRRQSSRTTDLTVKWILASESQQRTVSSNIMHLEFYLSILFFLISVIFRESYCHSIFFSLTPFISKWLKAPSLS